MSQIFVGQTALKFILDTGIDLTNAMQVKIKFRRPDGTTGEWNAEIEPPPSNGRISYTIQTPGDLNIAGNWQLWAFVVFSDNTYAPGEIANVRVCEEGRA